MKDPKRRRAEWKRRCRRTRGGGGGGICVQFWEMVCHARDKTDDGGQQCLLSLCWSRSHTHYMQGGFNPPAPSAPVHRSMKSWTSCCQAVFKHKDTNLIKAERLSTSPHTHLLMAVRFAGKRDKGQSNLQSATTVGFHRPLLLKPIIVT